MPHLLDLIRNERRRRTGSDDGEFIVVHLRRFAFCEDNRPLRAYVGGNSKLEKSADESFEAFEERAIVAAKAAGATVVAIDVPEPLCFR